MLCSQVVANMADAWSEYTIFHGYALLPYKHLLLFICINLRQPPFHSVNKLQLPLCITLLDHLLKCFRKRSSATILAATLPAKVVAIICNRYHLYYCADSTFELTLLLSTIGLVEPMHLS